MFHCKKSSHNNLTKAGDTIPPGELLVNWCNKQKSKLQNQITKFKKIC